MRITKSFEYSATPAQVFAMVTDPAFQERKCEATHALRHEVTITPDGAGTDITVLRVMPTDGLPPFAKSMVGARLPITETVVWDPAAADGSRSGRLTLSVAESPVGMTGTTAMVPTPGGTRVDIEGELKARIPLLGGQIEKAAAPAIIDAIDIEHETGVAWLAR